MSAGKNNLSNIGRDSKIVEEYLGDKTIVQLLEGSFVYGEILPSLENIYFHSEKNTAYGRH